MRLLDFAKMARPSYEFDWFHLLLFDLLERCATGDPEVENLLVSLPPGSGKTEIVMILFAAWLVAHNPLREHVIAISNADNLARLACSNALRVLQHPEIAEQFPLSFDKQTETSFTVTGSDGRPAMIGTSIMGQVTGSRATWVLADDLVKNLEVAYSDEQLTKIWENFAAVVETRLLPKGRIVAIATRWCLKDVHQRLLDRASKASKGRQFTYVNLAAWNDSGESSFIQHTRTGERIPVPRYRALAKVADQPYSFTRDDLESKKEDVGPSLWSALYMGDPVSTDSQLFPADCWGRYDSLDLDAYDLVVTSWDFASKTGSQNDWSANVVLGRHKEGRIHVLDAFRTKSDFAGLPNLVHVRWQSIAQKFRCIPLLVCEDASAGTQVIQLFQSEQPHVPLIVAKPAKSKLIRAEGVTPLTRGGLVALPTSAGWLDAFIREYASFPVGKNDDLVDAGVHGLKAFSSKGDFKPIDGFIVAPGRLLPRQPTDRELAAGLLDDPPEPDFECSLNRFFEEGGGFR